MTLPRKQVFQLQNGDSLVLSMTPHLLEVMSNSVFEIWTETGEILIPVKTGETYRLRSTASDYKTARTFSFKSQQGATASFVVPGGIKATVRGPMPVQIGVASRKRRLRNAATLVIGMTVIIVATVLITVAVLGLFFPGMV